MAGIKAGLMTLVLGPPIAGAGLGLALIPYLWIARLTEILTAHRGFWEALAEGGSALASTLLLIPMAALWSYMFGAPSAAVAAVYVSIRIGFFRSIGWTETALLAVACLAFTPGAPEYFFSLRLPPGWTMGLLLVPPSLFAAIVLRYYAARFGLVERKPADEMF